MLADHVGANILGPYASHASAVEDIVISGLGSLQTAEAGQITHLSNPSYRGQLAATAASAVILLAQDATSCPTHSLVVANPYLAFAQISQLFEPQIEREGLHPSAQIAASVSLGKDVSIGQNVVISAGCVIGDGVTIGANTLIGAQCTIAAGAVLNGNVTLYRRVKIGARTIIHSGAVLGAAGFGFTPNDQGKFETIAQLGGVQIGSDVSIGAGSTIDCGTIEDTVIEDGVKIDNLVQIGHNCHVGAHSLICGCTGLAGSTVIGKHCVLAGGVGVGGQHPVHICDKVILSARTVVSQSISQPGTYSGSVLATDHATWLRNAVSLKSLGTLFKRVKKLENGADHESD